MKCVICKSPDIQRKEVQEEIKTGGDIVLIPLEILVCLNCGERYYDRKSMKKIEELKQRVIKHELRVKEVGKVFLAEAV
jgi:YgiT-type zinc finger domain-containing protein